MRGLAYNPGILPAEMIIRQRVKPMPSREELLKRNSFPSVNQNWKRRCGSVVLLESRLITIEAKCAKMAAENTSLKQSEKEFNDFCREEFSEWEDDVTETPATDAFLAEIERKAIRKFINSIEHILRDKLSPYDTEEMLEAMRYFSGRTGR